MQDISAILASLELVPDILEHMVREVPPERMALRRGKDFWTLGEHLRHLAEVQPMVLERLRRIRDEEHPEFVPFLPPDGAAPADAPAPDTVRDLNAFRAKRAEQMALLRALPEEAWRREATHPEYHAYGMHLLARHILMHDYWHMYRMEELWLMRDAFLHHG